MIGPALQSCGGTAVVHSLSTPLQTVRQLFEQLSVFQVQGGQGGRSVQEYDVSHRTVFTVDQTAEHTAVEGGVTAAELGQ